MDRVAVIYEVNGKTVYQWLPKQYKTIIEAQEAAAWVIADLYRSCGIDEFTVFLTVRNVQCGDFTVDYIGLIFKNGTVAIGNDRNNMNKFYPYQSEKAIRGQRSLGKGKSCKKTKKAKNANVSDYVRLSEGQDWALQNH